MRVNGTTTGGTPDEVNDYVNESDRFSSSPVDSTPLPLPSIRGVSPFCRFCWSMFVPESSRGLCLDSQQPGEIGEGGAAVD